MDQITVLITTITTFVEGISTALFILSFLIAGLLYGASIIWPEWGQKADQGIKNTIKGLVIFGTASLIVNFVLDIF